MSDGLQRACGAPHILVERFQASVDDMSVWMRGGQLVVEDCPDWCDGELGLSVDISAPEGGPFPYQGLGTAVRADWCSTFTVGTTPMWPERCDAEGERLQRPCSYVGKEAVVEVREWSDTLLDVAIVLPLTPTWREGRSVICDTPGSLECIGYDVKPEMLTLTVEAHIPLEEIDTGFWAPVGSD